MYRLRQTEEYANSLTILTFNCVLLVDCNRTSCNYSTSCVFTSCNGQLARTVSLSSSCTKSPLRVNPTHRTFDRHPVSSSEYFPQTPKQNYNYHLIYWNHTSQAKLCQDCLSAERPPCNSLEFLS